MCHLPRKLTRARPRERVQCACVRLRGRIRERLRGVRAVRARALQRHARQRDVRDVPCEYQHDGGGARVAGRVPVRARLLLARVSVLALRRRLFQGPRRQRGVRAVSRRHVLS